MGHLRDLFSGIYPDRPGWKKTDTSAEAADKIEPRAATLRGKCLAHIRSCGDDGATADEVAAAIDETVLAIRPRITELKQMNLISDSGNRRRNVSGNRAAVMIAS